MSIPSQVFDARICKALGLEPAGIVSLAIKIAAGDLVTVDVRRLVSAEEAGALLDAIEEERFTLEKRP
jgi:hypothetical protein